MGFDVVVCGGRGHLVGAMNGASEGLRSILIRGIAAVRQAAANAPIENYLGPEREPQPCQRIGDERCVACIRTPRGRRVRARYPKTRAVAR